LTISLGLRAKILVFALACVLLPLLGVGVYLLDQNERVLRDKAREGLASAVSRQAAGVDEWLRQRMQEAHSFSLSFVVYEGVEAILGGTAKAPRARRELAEYLATVLPHHPHFESLFVTDLDGKMLAATRDEAPDPQWAADLAPARTSVLTPVRRSMALGRPTLSVIQGISGRSGHVVAWLFARIDVRALERVLQTAPGGPTPWLVDEQGRVVAEAGRVVADPGVRAFPLALAGSDADVWAAEGDLAGSGHVLYAVRLLGGPLPGRLVVSESAAAAYRPLIKARRRLLVGGLGVLLVVVALNLVAARGLSQSLRRLAEGARRMSAGDLQVELPPVSGRDEVAELTASFNEMARRVRESHGELARANDELRSANRTLETLSITDGLTGLYNHRHFYDTLERELKRGVREGSPLSLLLLDLDRFKQYNDTHGHAEGDAALRLVAQEVRASVRASDQAFRYGGEELAVLLPACGAEEAREVAEKIRAAVECVGQRDTRHAVTLSAGAATAPDHGDTTNALVKAADAALYQAKKSGRNRVAVAAAVVDPAFEDARR
jgi:diguanylate cyclase (GGDEF)-like protein